MRHSHFVRVWLTEVWASLAIRWCMCTIMSTCISGWRQLFTEKCSELWEWLPGDITQEAQTKKLISLSFSVSLIISWPGSQEQYKPLPNLLENCNWAFLLHCKDCEWASESAESMSIHSGVCRKVTANFSFQHRLCCRLTGQMVMTEQGQAGELSSRMVWF